MTEVPEHLLERSRARRAALGLAGGDEGSAEAAPAKQDAPSSAAPAKVEERAPAAAPAAAAAPAVVEEKPVPSYLRPEAKKTRIPMWVVPVLAVLPFWGVLYVGAFGDRTKEEALTGVALGAQVYRAQGCSSCHGGGGEGGVGPPLAGGEAAKTFPEEQAHADWIKNGSGPARGQMYGDPEREGGQRGPATGGMPGFPQLSEAELQAVVLYEREGL